MRRLRDPVRAVTEENDTPSQDLPPLEGEAAALVARFPMREGSPDALLNKKMLGAAMGVSTTTIDTWLTLTDGQAIPYVERGTNGRSYVFRLSVAHAWRMARQEAEEADRQVADDAVAQYRMDLLGGEAVGAARLALSPKERAEALKVEKEWILAAAARREYMASKDVSLAFESSFAAIRDGFDAAPDRLGRKLNLSASQIADAQVILDDILTNAAAILERKLAGEDDDE